MFTVVLGLLFVAPLCHLLVRGVASPAGATLEYFARTLADVQFYRLTLNSLFIASSAAIGSTFLASLSGFVLATYRFPGRRLYVVVLIFLASLPAQLLIPGGYEVVTRLHLFDTHLAVLLPASVSVFGVLLFRAAFSGTPGDLLAAGRIDGCSELRLWWHIALPTVRATTAASLCLSFVAYYNAVVWPMVVLQSDHLATLPMYLTNLSGVALTPEDHARVAAGTVLAMVPVFGVFLLLQRDFLPALRGAIKG